MRNLELCASWFAASLTFAIALAFALPAQAAGAAAERATADAVPSDWLPRVERALAEKEYEASRNARGLQAPNRAHGLRTYFEPGGIRVVDRTAAGGPELLGLRLARIGRGDALAPVAPGEVTNEGARVEIRRPGVVEWYLNSRLTFRTSLRRFLANL